MSSDTFMKIILFPIIIKTYSHQPSIPHILPMGIAVKLLFSTCSEKFSKRQIPFMGSEQVLIVLRCMNTVTHILNAHSFLK